MPRKLSRSEVRRVARAAGVSTTAPCMFDGTAELLIEAGIQIGLRLYHNVHAEAVNAGLLDSPAPDTNPD